MEIKQTQFLNQSKPKIISLLDSYITPSAKWKYLITESSKNAMQIISCCAWNVGGHKYFFITTKLHFNCGVKSHFLAALCHEFLNHHQSNYQKITSDKNVDYDYFKYAKLIPTSNTVWICAYTFHAQLIRIQLRN